LIQYENKNKLFSNQFPLSLNCLLQAFMEKKTRPIFVTLICIAGFIGVVLSFPSIFSPFIKKMGDFYPALFGCIIAGNFISIVGVWNMKRWGVHLYLASGLVGQIAHLLADNWSVFSIILPCLFLLVTGFYYRQMDEDL